MDIAEEESFRITARMKDVAAIAFVILAAFVISVAKGYLDDKRIHDHVEAGGSEVLGIVWKRFGKGWFGSGNQRIYEVTYRTRDGQTFTATCKTGMFAGVYWTGNVPPPTSSADKKHTD
jgi:hypothetical protein